MSNKRHFVLAAGGTGGHMIPAHALAEELADRGHSVALVTDARGARFPGLFGKAQVHVMPAGRLAGGPLGWVKAGRDILSGRAMARRLYKAKRPAAVIGFGGYPALPALLAAKANGIPTLIHEQNAVLGRVNRLLARQVKAIATAYPDIQRLKPAFAKKVELVGNPVRGDVLRIRGEAYPKPASDGEFHVLVTGGSQGATILSKVVPAGLSALPESLRKRLNVVQQCRAEDLDAVRAAYAAASIPAELATYLPDLPDRLAWSHLFIGRSGASSIAELTAAGRPAILIPFGAATDDHQTFNAREMAQAGGAKVISQGEFTPERLAAEMQAFADPDRLAEAAAHARAVGRPDAHRHLADLVERIAGISAPASPVPAKNKAQAKAALA